MSDGWILSFWFFISVLCTFCNLRKFLKFILVDTSTVARLIFLKIFQDAVFVFVLGVWVWLMDSGIIDN